MLTISRSYKMGNQIEGFQQDVLPCQKIAKKMKKIEKMDKNIYFYWWEFAGWEFIRVGVCQVGVHQVRVQPVGICRVGVFQVGILPTPN